MLKRIYSIGNYVSSGVSSVASSLSATAKYTAGKVQEIGSAALHKAVTVGSEAIQTLENGVKHGMKAYEVVYHPQKVLTEALHSYFGELDLRDALTKAYSEATQQRIALFFQTFEKQQNTALTKKMATKLGKETIYLCSTTLNEPLTDLQENQIDLIISKLPAIVTEANAQKLAASLFSVSSKIIESMVYAMEASDPSQVKARLLGYTVATHPDIDQAFEKETEVLKERVNKNLCTLLGSFRKEAEIFTWKHFFALIAYIAVRFFGYGIDILNSMYAVTNKELNRFQELSSKFEGCDEYLFLKFSETLTAELLNKTPVSQAEVDREWDRLAEISSPYLLRFLSSKLAQRSIFLRAAVGVTANLIGGPVSITSRIRPSEVLPTVVKGMQDAVNRAQG